jgi:hypothetical protein
MDISLPEDFKEFLRLLNAHQIECLQQAMQIKAKNGPRISLAEVKRRIAEAENVAKAKPLSRRIHLNGQTQSYTVE